MSALPILSATTVGTTMKRGVSISGCRMMPAPMSSIGRWRKKFGAIQSRKPAKTIPSYSHATKQQHEPSLIA